MEGVKALGQLVIGSATVLTTRAGWLRLIGEGGIIAASLGDKSPEKQCEQGRDWRCITRE